MKKLILVTMMVCLASVGTGFAIESAAGLSPAAGVETSFQENWFDQAGDWFVTLGKSPEDRKVIIAQRRAERFKLAGPATVQQAESKVSDAAKQVISDAPKDIPSDAPSEAPIL
ncbi:MAG: hypothetical protein Q8R76_11440 [Candidatus Omnitrophota bacterium]|nr:hypothetical protein [Candidatus Omnitrophota bacterium]